MKTMDFAAEVTAEQALSQARKVARICDEDVLVTINGIVMIVYKNTKMQKALAEYQDRLLFKYEIEELKRQMKRTK